MADLEKVRTGQRFHPASEDWNAFIDAARADRAARLREHFDGELFDQSPVIVQVKNETGQHQPRMRVLGFNKSVHDPASQLDPFKNEIVFQFKVVAHFRSQLRAFRQHHDSFVACSQADFIFRANHPA